MLITFCCTGGMQCRKSVHPQLPSLFLLPLLPPPLSLLGPQTSFSTPPLSSSALRSLERCFQMSQRRFCQQTAQSQLECCSVMSCERMESHRILLFTWYGLLCIDVPIECGGGGGLFRITNAAILPEFDPFVKLIATLDPFSHEK